MNHLNRREFVVATAAACLCALGDAGELLADAPATGPSVLSATFDAGPKSAYSVDGITDKWRKKPHNVIITRHGGKIYASTSICTHKGCAVQKGTDNVNLGLLCHCHGATYDVEGNVTNGPAKRPLMRFGISLDANDHIIVDKSRTFLMSHWNDEGSFIKV